MAWPASSTTMALAPAGSFIAAAEEGSCRSSSLPVGAEAGDKSVFVDATVESLGRKRLAWLGSRRNKYYPLRWPGQPPVYGDVLCPVIAGRAAQESAID